MSAPKRLVQILYSGLGGHASVAFSLIEADKDHDFDHKLLFFGIEELNPAYLQKCQEEKIESFTVVKRSKLPFSDWTKIFRKLAAWKPQIIVLHSTTLIFPLILYRKTHSCKLIFAEHTPNHIKSVNEKLSSRLGMFFADQVVLLTTTYKEELKRAMGSSFKESKTVVIPNGINVEKFAPKHDHYAESTIHIGMIGRFSEGKSQDELIDAFCELLTDRPADDLHLHLAGDGATLEWLKSKVARTQFASRISFHGNINEKEIIDLLLTIDIYVHATKGETMSTAIMQAMACGLPVIGSSVPGVSNMIVNKITGVLYHPGDKNDLKECMIRLIDDRQLRHTLGVNARQFAIEEYSLVNMFKRYKAVF